MTGNYQVGSHIYAPATSSFLTPDWYRSGSSNPDLSIGVDPLTQNRYAYVNGDPVNHADPSGHYEVSDDGLPQGAELVGCNCDDNLGAGNTDSQPTDYAPSYNGGRGLPVVDKAGDSGGSNIAKSISSPTSA